MCAGFTVRVETAAGTRLLVGIGFNVSTRLDDAPEAVRAMAGSLAEIGDGLIDPGSLLEAFVGRFATVLPRLSADDPSLAARWAGLDALSGAAVRVDLGTRVVEGIGRGIDAEGALLLTTAQETLRVFGGRVLRGG